MCRVCYGLSKMQCLWRDMSCVLLQLVVGAVPMCPPVSPHKGASIVHPPHTMRVLVGMETPLRGRSGGHAGTAPTVSFGWIACGRVDFVWGELRVGRLISFVWDVWKNITEIGRGGACVPARVALQGRIHRSRPCTNCMCFWYGNAATRTFGRAHRHRPYGFVWEDCA